MQTPIVVQWHDSALMRQLFPHLFVGGRMPSANEVLEALLSCARVLAVALPRSKRSPSVEELLSDLIWLFINGYSAPAYKPHHDARIYLRGILYILLLSYDRKHRRRRHASLNTAMHDTCGRELSPLATAIRNECICQLKEVWPLLTESRQTAIRAEFGAVMSSDYDTACPYPKNYVQKHRGLRQLQAMMTPLT